MAVFISMLGANQGGLGEADDTTNLGVAQTMVQIEFEIGRVHHVLRLVHKLRHQIDVLPGAGAGIVR